MDDLRSVVQRRARTNAGILMTRMRRPNRRTDNYTLVFQFRPNNDTPILQRFDEMAQQIRLAIRSQFNVVEGGRRDRHPYLLDFIPANGLHQVQKTIRAVRSITGEFLFNIYESILQSQDTVTLDGFKVFFF